MKKFTICGISLCTLLGVTGANAAGYTCEELIEYTSCNDGFVLFDGRCEAKNGACNPGYYYELCPEGYDYGTDWCDDGYTVWDNEGSEDYCDVSLGLGCVKEVDEDEDGTYEDYDFISKTLEDVTSCTICPAGASCAGGDAPKVICVAGTYQPDAGKTTCITAAKGTYVSGVGATTFESCPATGYVGADGKSIVATTVTAGATGIYDCMIDPDAAIKGEKGIYHFKQNCVYNDGVSGGGNSGGSGVDAKAERCQELGGSWYPEGNSTHGYGEEMCVVTSSDADLPSAETEEGCDALNGDWQEDPESGEYYCSNPNDCDFLSSGSGDIFVYVMATGKITCENIQ